MGEVVYGSVLSQRLKDELKEKIEKDLQAGLKRPKLGVILVGEDPASVSYVKGKEKAAAYVGIDSEVHRLPEETTQEELNKLIRELNDDPKVDGILLQLPLSKQLDSREALELIDPSKDVDGLGIINSGKLFLKEEGFYPCTPLGVIELLKEMKVEIEGKHAVVVGRSNLVGLPVSRLLLNENATVTTCHSRTSNLKEITRQADILVVAIGKAEFITGDYIKEGAYVIDVGVNRVDGKLKGDVKFDEAVDKVAAITPVPKGVGPMTITMLMYNTYKARGDKHD
jgi:methylenetetrahydrofolate dehydrogenase (NADP+)/methenyltetrahydrofolate cyclohydrolase